MIDGHKIAMKLVNELLCLAPEQLLPEIKIPVLVQQGAEDKTVSLDHTDILKSGLKARRLDVTTYQDGDHGLTDDRHRKMIFFHIGQFVEKYG